VHGAKTGEPTAISGMTTKVHAPKLNFWRPSSYLHQLAHFADRDMVLQNFLLCSMSFVTKPSSSSVTGTPLRMSDSGNMKLTLKFRCQNSSFFYHVAHMFASSCRAKSYSPQKWHLPYSFYIFHITSTIFLRDERPETILTLSSLTPKCTASFFNSFLFALPRSGCDLIDMAISPPLTSSRPSELNLTETEYRTCSSWKRVLENLLLAGSNYDHDWQVFVLNAEES
jgi:hypothetical protein